MSRGNAQSDQVTMNLGRNLFDNFNGVTLSGDKSGTGGVYSPAGLLEQCLSLIAIGLDSQNNQL